MARVSSRGPMMLAGPRPEGGAWTGLIGCENAKLPERASGDLATFFAARSFDLGSRESH